MEKIILAIFFLGHVLGVASAAQEKEIPRFSQIFQSDDRFIKAYKNIRTSYETQTNVNYQLEANLKTEYNSFIKKNAIIEKRVFKENHELEVGHKPSQKIKDPNSHTSQRAVNSMDKRKASEVDAQAGYYYDYYSYYDDDSTDDNSEELQTNEHHFTTMDNKKHSKKSPKELSKPKRDLTSGDDQADDDAYNYYYYYSSPFDDDYVPQNESSLQGYLSYQFYSELGCSGIASYTAGSNIKNCMPYMDWSYRITFSDPNCFDLRIVFYEDSNCTNFVGATKLVGYTQCVNRKDDSYMSSSQLFCSTEADLPIYQPSVVISYFGNDSTCSDEIVEFGATAIDVCLKDYTYFYRNYTVPGNTSFVETCDNNEYNVTTYLFDNHCGGNSTSYTYPLSCFNVGSPAEGQTPSNNNLYYDYTPAVSQQSTSLRGCNKVSSKTKDNNSVIKSTTSVTTNTSDSYSILCSPYATSATMNADVNSPECSFSICGEQQVVINNCVKETCLGDSFIRLFNANGVEVASNDDGCSLCSSITYQTPSNIECQSFTLRQGCYDMTTCGGIFNVTVGPIPVNSSYVPTTDDDGDPYKNGFAQSSCVKTVSIRPTMMPVLPPTYSPTQIPTKKPSRIPTYLPTISDNAVQFGVYQIINGISTTQFINLFSINELVVKEAAADCMNGVSVADITNFGVISSSRRLLNLKIADIRSLATNSVQVYYAITADFDGASYSSLSNQLTSAVNDGTFDVYLNQYAVASGAADLEGCTSNSAQTINLNGGGDGGSSSLSTGAIAGIVIAIVAFFGFVASAIYYYLIVNKQQNPVLPTGAAPQPTESELVKSPNAPVVEAVPAIPTSEVKVISEEPNPLHN